MCTSNGFINFNQVSRDIFDITMIMMCCICCLPNMRALDALQSESVCISGGTYLLAICVWLIGSIEVTSRNGSMNSQLCGAQVIASKICGNVANRIAIYC